MKELLVAMGIKTGMTALEVVELIEKVGEDEAYAEIRRRKEKKEPSFAELAFDGLVKESEASIPREDGDYIKDGLLYCGKCNTPKQMEVDFGLGVKKPMIMCDCRKAVVYAEEERQRKRQFDETVKRNRSIGFPDMEMQNMTFSNDDGSNPELTKIAKNYVENFGIIRHKHKNGLLFFGGVGTGKTYTATCIANALFDKGERCLVTNFARVVNTMQSSDDKQGYLDSLNDFDLLVIDDLASERNTEYMDEHVFNVIDGRVRCGKPMIVTTNLTGIELKDSSNIRKSRIYSRLMEACLPYEVKGTDRRRASFRKPEFDELKTLLGL